MGKAKDFQVNYEAIDVCISGQRRKWDAKRTVYYLKRQMKLITAEIETNIHKKSRNK